GDYPYEAVRLADGDGTAERCERETALLDLIAGVDGLLLRETGAGYLRVGEDCPRDGLPLGDGRHPRDRLRSHDAFLLSLVRQHRHPPHVADGVDARHAGAHRLVSLDEPLGVEFDPDRLYPEPRSEGTPPDAD